MAGFNEHQGDSGPRPARICLLDREPRASTVGLANALARQGFNVTLLFIEGSGKPAVAAGASLHEGVSHERLVATDGLFVQLPFAARVSYLTYLYLRDREFDVIQFPAYGGAGYYTQLARRQGLAFRNTPVVVRLGSTRSWTIQHDNSLIEDVTVLDEMFMERRSIVLADQLVSENEALLSWLRDEEPSVLQHRCVLADLPLAAGTGEVAAGSRQRLESDWLGLYRQILTTRTNVDEDRVSPEAPLVSVCLVHFNRPQLLSRMIESLYGQDYTNFEVILVDDGSTLPEAKQYIDSLESIFSDRGWRIVRQQNAYVGAARNNAVRHARGDYLLFLDDDNVATPRLLSTFVRVMQKTGADILTCATNVFEGEGAVPESVSSGTHWVPLGASVASGLFRNIFGDASALIRRSVFDQLGGFSEDYGLGHEDWEFFARAVLRGYQLEVVPEPLLFYRVRSGGMLLSSNTEASLARSLRPYLEAVPAELRPVLRLALGQEHARNTGPAGLCSPADVLKLVKGFAVSRGKRGMAKRFMTVVRSQGWGRAIRAVLRYGKQGT